MKNFLFLSLAVTFFLLHFEGARVILLGAPVYLVEIGVMVAAVALVLVRKREHGMVQFVGANNYSPVPKCDSHVPVPIRWGIFFLLFGVISSTLAALSSHSICPLSHEGLLRALGIMKSWFVFPILFGYIFFHASHTYFSREKLIFIFLVSFLPISILSLTGWIFGSGMTYDGRLEGFFNSPNALAMHLTPALILSWYFSRTYVFRSQFFIFHFSLFIFAVSLLFLTRSYSAWIAVTAGIFVFEFFRVVIPAKAGIQSQPAKYNLPTNKICSVPAESKWNLDPLRQLAERMTSWRILTKIRWVFFLLFAILLILSQWDNPRFENFFDPDSRSSFASRLMIWQSAGKMIADSPFFGIGPGNFGSCYLAYQKYFPPYLEWSVPEPHNLFLAFWLGGGLVGLSSFSFLLFSWFRNIFRRIQKEGDGLLLALVAIMMATLLHGLVDTTYWRLGLSYMFWVVFFAGIRKKNDK